MQNVIKNGMKIFCLLKNKKIPKNINAIWITSKVSYPKIDMRKIFNIGLNIKLKAKNPNHPLIPLSSFSCGDIFSTSILEGELLKLPAFCLGMSWIIDSSSIILVPSFGQKS